MKHARNDYNRIQDPTGLIPDDEPVFLIRAQDILAPGIVAEYATRLEALGRADPTMVAVCREHSNRMREWQREHGNKVPDMPHQAIRFDV